MKQKEYLTVAEISNHHKTSSRNVRRILNNIQKEHNEFMIFKENNERWKVHHLLLNKFKPQRKRVSKYYALTIKPISEISVEMINAKMKFVFDQLNEEDLVINYSIESGKFNNFLNHIHCFIRTKRKEELTRLFKDTFYDDGNLVVKNDRKWKAVLKKSKIYDLDRWKKYITKDGSPIITLKN